MCILYIDLNFDTIIKGGIMDKLILFLNSRIEEELTILITVMLLILLTVICLTIIKKIKDK